MPELTNEELDLIRQLLNSAEEQTSCLSIYEQLNMYEPDGTYDHEKADWVEHVFKGLVSKFNEGS